VLPHHDRYGKNWAPSLTEQLPDRVLIGVDEATGMLSDAAGTWAVYGAGAVTLYRGGQARVHARGETFTL
jgi:cyanophycinase-like exopeptidase